MCKHKILWVHTQEEPSQSWEERKCFLVERFLKWGEESGREGDRNGWFSRQLASAKSGDQTSQRGMEHTLLEARQTHFSVNQILPTNIYLAVSQPKTPHFCINSPCLLPTFGWGWEAVLAEMPWWGGCQRMLLLTHQFLVLLGRSRPGPHLAWKGTFSEFSVCHLGFLYLSYFPNKLLNFICLLWLWWGEELETGCTSSTEIWCVGFLI